MKRGEWLAVVVLAAGLRLVGLDHGLPHRFVPDTHMVRGALGMAKTKDLAPPAGTFTSYPYLMPYLLLPGYAALYGVGRMTGEYASAADFGDKVTDDPTPLYLIAHAWILALGVLGVVFAHRLARRVLGEREALVVAYLVATSFLLVHLGKSARPWVPMVTFVLIAAERAVAYAQDPTRKRALWLGLATGLAGAVHQAGMLAVLLPAGAILGRARKDGVASVFTRGALAALAFGVTVVLLGHPYVLRGSETSVGVSEAAEKDAETVNFGGQGVALDAFGFDRVRETAVGFAGAEPALLVLAALGLAAGWRRLRERGVGLALGVYPAAVLVLFLFYSGTHTRYLVTAVPFLALLGAVAVTRLWTSAAGRVLACVLLAMPLVGVLRLDWLMTREDTRVEFLRTVASNVPAGARVAVEGYGPPLRYSADALTLLSGPWQWTSRAEQREAAGLAPMTPDRPGYAVVPLERFYQFASVWPRQWWEWKAEGDPERPIESFLDEHAIRHLVMVDRAPGGPRNSALDDVVLRRGEKLAELAPFDVAPAAEARLPMDPDVAWRALWSVDRTGPKLTLWRLRDR
ncbi:MAG: hypothetical protein IT459_17495 [Planctomycetes bacterium]|nr:hypothetical protein [Planctomycetota bacterium]